MTIDYSTATIKQVKEALEKNPEIQRDPQFTAWAVAHAKEVDDWVNTLTAFEFFSKIAEGFSKLKYEEWKEFSVAVRTDDVSGMGRVRGVEFDLLNQEITIYLKENR